MISVIIPNYNYSRYLRERIDSVLGQTYSDIEVIMLDDCSTDNSVEIMKSYDDPRIVGVFLNEHNSGSPFEQWRRGLEKAMGEYVWIAEADDSADIHFLEETVKTMEKEKAVLGFAASVMVTAEGCSLAKDYDHWKRRRIVEGGYSVYSGRQFAVGMQYWRNCVYNASGVVFRRDAVGEDELKALDMRYSGDWLFWTGIGLKGNVVELRRRLNRFRFHDGSVTHKGAYEGFLEDIEVVGIFNERFNINPFKRCFRKMKFRRRWKRMGFDSLCPV